QRGHFVPHRQPLLPAGSPCAAGPVLPATDWGIAHIAEYDDRRARVTPRGAGGGIALNRLRGAVTVVTYPGWQWTLSGGWGTFCLSDRRSSASPEILSEPGFPAHQSRGGDSMPALRQAGRLPKATAPHGPAHKT